MSAERVEELAPRFPAVHCLGDFPVVCRVAVVVFTTFTAIGPYKSFGAPTQTAGITTGWGWYKQFVVVIAI